MSSSNSQIFQRSRTTFMGGARGLRRNRIHFGLLQPWKKYLVPHPQQRPNTATSNVKSIHSGLLWQSSKELKQGEIQKWVRKFAGGGAWGAWKTEVGTIKKMSLIFNLLIRPRIEEYFIYPPINSFILSTWATFRSPP